MKLRHGHQYRVKWIDAFGQATWTNDEELAELIKTFEQGADQTLYFIKQTDDFYIFTSGKPIKDRPYLDIHGIPKGWITQIKEVR